MAYEPKSKRRLSRRQILRSGAAALGGTGALLAGATAAAPEQGPAVLTGTQSGRTFRGLVRHDTTLDVQELRLLTRRGSSFEERRLLPVRFVPLVAPPP